MKLLARNLSTGTIVAARVAVASTAAERAIGLLSRRAMEDDEGLWIVPCRGVHTCFMRFPIDLVALDTGGLVIDRAVGLRPWRLRWPRARTVGVLELAAGTLDRSGTELGHRIVFETEGGSR